MLSDRNVTFKRTFIITPVVLIIGTRGICCRAILTRCSGIVTAILIVRVLGGRVVAIVTSYVALRRALIIC